MAIPGLVKPLEDDLRMLKENDVGAIVTLTEHPILLPLPYRNFFKLLHLPVENLEPPTLKQVRQFVDFVEAEFKRGVNVAVHCLMGIGRTGTMIAAYRVSLGEGPDEAISNLRAIRNFIETKDQEEMVHTYHRYLLKKGGKK
jgi:atypical dual specificity phosphatase